VCAWQCGRGGQGVVLVSFVDSPDCPPSHLVINIHIQMAAKGMERQSKTAEKNEKKHKDMIKKVRRGCLGLARPPPVPPAYSPPLQPNPSHSPQPTTQTTRPDTPLIESAHSRHSRHQVTHSLFVLSHCSACKRGTTRVPRFTLSRRSERRANSECCYPWHLP
jgi:hypothetical protein